MTLFYIQSYINAKDMKYNLLGTVGNLSTMIRKFKYYVYHVYSKS